MKKILSILTVGCALTLSSCEDWLDKYPLAQMSPETFFSNENELQAFSNTFYTIFPGDGRTIPASGGGWTWTDLRKFNTLLEYSGNCKDTDIRNRYDAVARFFRAYFYFEKVKRFGDVPWYAKPLGSADPELKRPRDSREFVMQRMIEDIDFAIRYLPAERDLYRVTKWTALALKSRFCLFEGTFRKYHSIDGYEHDWKWYLEQAADAAEEFITNSGYSLYTATGPATSYRDLFASENAQSVEVILARDYNSALGVFHNANFYTISASYGKPGMTRKIVDSYLMADGSRFTDKAGWETMEFKQQCSNRDPRLAQTIRTPGYTRIGATTKLAPDLANSITGYHVVKFVTGTAQDAYNKSFNDLPIFRSAEVYLNFAEAKAELGTLTQEDINLSVKRLRDRVGMSNLILDDANKNPDPYLSDEKTGYPNVTGANKGGDPRNPPRTHHRAGDGGIPLLRHHALEGGQDLRTTAAGPLHPRQGRVRHRRRRNARRLFRHQGRDALDHGQTDTGDRPGHSLLRRRPRLHLATQEQPRHLGRNPRLFLSDSDRRPLADGRRPDPEPRMERRTEFLTAKQTEKCWNS